METKRATPPRIGIRVRERERRGSFYVFFVVCVSPFLLTVISLCAPFHVSLRAPITQPVTNEDIHLFPASSTEQSWRGPFYFLRVI